MTWFFFIFFQNLAKNEENPSHGNLWMSCPYSTYESVSETGEFGHTSIMTKIFIQQKNN